MTVRVTGSNYDYEGSITIDKELAQKVGFVEHEEVFIHNPNGNRDRTYVLYGEKGDIQINGALSSNHKKGDVIHVLAFEEIGGHGATVCKPMIWKEKTI